MKVLGLAALFLTWSVCHSPWLPDASSQEPPEFNTGYKASIGEKVYTLKKEGPSSKRIDGVISGIKKNRDDTPYMLIEFPEPPVTGSPVFLNDRVIGMVYRQSTTGNLFEAMPVIVVIDFLKSLNMPLTGTNIPAGKGVSDEVISVIKGHLEAKEYDKAVKTLKGELEKNPDNSELRGWMGVAMMEMGNPQGATLEFKKAISMEPDYPDFHNGLGYAMLALGNFESAVDSFKEALRLDPKHADSHYGIGTAYVNLGNAKLALKEYSILKELDGRMADNLFKFMMRRGNLETE